MIQFATEFQCLWFSTITEVEDPHEFEVSCEEENPGSDYLHGPFRSHKEVCQIIEEKARPRSWPEAIDTIRAIQSQATGHSRFPYMYGPQYKPVYFLL
jgi:hypothetical protein